ncbi:MAG: PDZ domain-containing protein, partial [Luteimonas sp.]
LVGINTASFNPQGSMAGNIGLGFAIPANLAGDVMRQLVATGEVRRGTLGVDTQDAADFDVRGLRALKLDVARGAVVTRVYPDSAAATAGLQPQDVIVGANGQRIDDSEGLRNFQGLQAANARVTLDVVRDGKTMPLTIGLREQARALSGATLDARLTGATFAELPEALRRSGVNGVLVEKIERNSRAATSGLLEKDVILAASSGQFGDLAGFRTTLSQKPEQLVLRILRGRSQGNLLMQ